MLPHALFFKNRLPQNLYLSEKVLGTAPPLGGTSNL